MIAKDLRENMPSPHEFEVVEECQQNVGKQPVENGSQKQSDRHKGHVVRSLA